MPIANDGIADCQLPIANCFRTFGIANRQSAHGKWQLAIGSRQWATWELAIGNWQLAMINLWHFDPAYSTVEFVVRNLWYNVKGRFNVLEGSIVLDEDDIRRSSVTATIRANSIDTGNKRRDAHLQSPAFLEVEKFPDLEFKSLTVARGRDRDSLDVDGTLTIRDKHVPIALAVNEMDRSRSPRGEEYVYYSATTELDRYAFGIAYGRGLIGRKLKVTINVQARNNSNMRSST